MAYPGEYRREEFYGEDGYGEGGNYGARGRYPTEGGYSGEGYGGSALPYGEQYEYQKPGHHGHHHRPEYVPEVEYVQPEVSDLGMGLGGTTYVQGGYGGGGYGGGYGRNQPGYGAPAAYGSGGLDSYEHAKVERLEEELAHERRKTHEAEAAAAAASAYALHERHERRESDDEEERFEPGEEHRRKHHFFGL
ncbi:hypothetical protein KC19_7G156700 [Ceratodon purpureus]|uniref:Uncharacterized protein n=1 Tax=Ceratodon purpureus TaxID=3225 RepID=A0A8T0H705_CERPU|nr:hypothetical protein KC19_7G156700 [Ceratodon purpureus]